MTITRETNGVTVEIELTKPEMFHAYIEQEHEYDMSDIDCWCQDDDNPLTDEQIEAIAYEYRDNLDRSDNCMVADWHFDMASQAYETVIGRKL